MVTFGVLGSCVSSVFELLPEMRITSVNARKPVPALSKMSLEERRACVWTGLGRSGLLRTVLGFSIIFYLSTTMNLWLTENPPPSPILYMTTKETKYAWFTPGAPRPSKERALTACFEGVSAGPHYSSLPYCGSAILPGEGQSMMT